MKRSKKIFLVVALIFIVLVLFVAYDISQRTTFPGQKREKPVDATELQLSE